MSSIYSGLATFGRINAIIGTVVVGIIAIIIIGVGIHLILKEPLKTAKTTGTITAITPSSYTVHYNVDNNIYTTGISGSNSENFIGKSVTVNYDPNNPHSARVGFSNRKLGTILIISALVVCLLVGLNTYFIMKSKTYAAVTGGMDALQDIRQI